MVPLLNASELNEGTNNFHIRWFGKISMDQCSHSLIGQTYLKIRLQLIPIVELTPRIQLWTPEMKNKKIMDKMTSKLSLFLAKSHLYHTKSAISIYKKLSHPLWYQGKTKVFRLQICKYMTLVQAYIKVQHALIKYKDQM